MIRRLLNESDRKILDESIQKDSYHRETTTPDFFYDRRSFCDVYEDENKPVMFVRASKTLRLDIQFCDNGDKLKNMAALHELESITERAKAAGFTELVFCSDSPLLRAYCIKHFKFNEVQGELRRYL
jgi:hypothetical protein